MPGVGDGAHLTKRQLLTSELYQTSWVCPNEAHPIAVKRLSTYLHLCYTICELLMCHRDRVSSNGLRSVFG